MQSIFLLFLLSIVTANQLQVPKFTNSFRGLRKRNAITAIVTNGGKQITIQEIKQLINSAIKNLNPLTASESLKSFANQLPTRDSLSKLLRPPAQKKPLQGPVVSTKVEAPFAKNALTKVESAARRNWLNKLKELGAEFIHTTMTELLSLGISVVAGTAYTVVTDEFGAKQKIEIDPISGIPLGNVSIKIYQNESKFYYLGHPLKITDDKTGIEYYFEIKTHRYFCLDQSTGMVKYYSVDNTDSCKPVEPSNDAEPAGPA